MWNHQKKEVKRKVHIHRRRLATFTLIPLIFSLVSLQGSLQKGLGWNDHSWRGLSEKDIPRVSLVAGLQCNVPNAWHEVKHLTQLCGGNIVKTIEMGALSAIIVEIPGMVSSEFTRQVKTKGLVRYVEPNLQFRVNLIPNDPNWTIQWGPQKIQADHAWNTTLGGHQVLVSVVDTGIDYNHQDLSPNYNASGYDWVENDTDPMDLGWNYEGHGTHCAGIIAAKTDNGIGMAGLAQVQIMAERVNFYIDECAEAIKHSADKGAEIISCSWGDYFDSKLLHDAIKYAYQKGVLIIAGAGNDNSDFRLYPAAYNEVIGVSGTDSSDSKADFSNYGDWIELAAPAVNIFSTFPNNSYTFWSGTSFAGPHVVGVAALAWSRSPNLTRDQVRVQLRYTADDLGPSGFDDVYGYGRTNAKNAVETALPDNDLTLLHWDPPLKRVDPHQNLTIRASIHNFGLYDAYNVSSQLLANDTVIDEVNLPILESGETIVANYSWTPIQEGKYNLTCSLSPVVGETMLIDNMLQTEVEVNYRKAIKVPSDYPTISAALAAANDGDTILVSPGVYNEYISIEKSVSLEGSGREVTIISDAVVVEAPFVKISGFTICNGSTGIFLHKVAQNTTISDNTISNCNGLGIHVDCGFGILILNNVISNVTIGLYTKTAFQYCEVIGNNFTMNDVGIMEHASWSRGNLFCFNNFIDNCASVDAFARRNAWDYGYPLGGNYWSEYNGTDTYRGQFQNVTGIDGIGDTAYEITGTSGKCEDRYPLMRPWSRPRNHGFERRGWSVFVGLNWNASNGWRDRKGDVNGDGVVNIYDVVIVTGVYGSHPGDPNWDPVCDLNGDGVVDIYDVVMVTSEYGSEATRLTGAYSWFSNGSPSSNFTMWQEIDVIHDLRNQTVQFSFYFYPDVTAQIATAMIYYATSTSGQWITGSPKNGTAQQWNQASVTATIPEDAVEIQIWVRGQTNFQAYLDNTTLVLEG